MKKCGNDSARAGESNATFTGWIDPHPTQPHSNLSPRGCSSKTSHTHTHKGAIFVKIDRRWKINRNSEKCGKMCIRLSAQGRPGWCRFSILGAFSVPHLHQQQPVRTASTPHGPVGFQRRLCGNEKKIAKNMEKCASYSARAGESNATFTGWIGPLPTRPHAILSPRRYISKTSHTHPCPGSVLWSTSIDGGKSAEIQKNVEKCAFAFGVWGMARLVSSSSCGGVCRSPPQEATTQAHTVWIGISSATLQK